MWQKRGVGLWKESYEISGYNPIKQLMANAARMRINVEYELPLGEKYADFVQNLFMNAIVNTLE